MSDFDKIISLLSTQESISEAQVIEWMSSKDIKVLGVLYVLTNKAWDRIRPELKMEDICGFILDYYKRCIQENPDPSDYLFNRYEAGREFAAWFKHLWAKKPETDDVLIKAKETLAEFYLQDNKEIQDCIVNAVLEHIFEEKAMIPFFRDWQTADKLDEAYRLALEWGKAN